MFYRAKRAISRAWFNFNCSAVLRTPPISSSENDLTLVSMVCHGETLMYLLAVKSFCSRLKRSPAIVVLNDGSLTESDRSVIQDHFPKVRIVPISEVSTGACPKGSCWERLLLINDLNQDSYIVQLDCDTLTLGPIEEVRECIAANRSFSLMGDRSYPEVEPMNDACARSKNNTSDQVQAICERAFDQLPEAAELKYVRGNAGFTGFAKNTLDRAQIQSFSDLMRRISGAKWDTWGSEQVTSNLLIANTEGAVPLQAPKYLSYWAHPDVDYDRSSFIHFIGPFRFAHGLYLRHAKRIIRELAP